jgi:sulfate transport system ATP-binding protein
VRSGTALIGSLSLPAPAYGGVLDSAGTAFVRPHDLQLYPIGDGPGTAAEVRHVSILGPLVRVELWLDGITLEAEISRQRHAELGLVAGQRVLVWPRQARVFLHDSGQGASLDYPESAIDPVI